MSNFENWVPVYSTSKLYEAEMIKSLMADNDIECVIMNKQDSIYMFGDVELYVPTNEAFSAKQLILQYQSE